ncbi:MAG: lasso peptide biosynthesis B2 protein [Candidatus Omnitrophota bacterium]
MGSIPAQKRLSLVEVKGLPDPKVPREKLEKYLTFVYFIMGRLWIRPSCFTNSVAVCRIFKKKGFDARITFGCAFEKDKLKGHCWVELDREAETKKFQPVFSYPLSSLFRLESFSVAERWK